MTGALWLLFYLTVAYTWWYTLTARQFFTAWIVADVVVLLAVWSDSSPLWRTLGTILFGLSLAADVFLLLTLRPEDEGRVKVGTSFNTWTRAEQLEDR